MHITRVILGARSLDEVADFSVRVLGLAVARSSGGELDDESVVVEIGATRVEYIREVEATGVHHLAFTIPTGSFAQAKSWLSSRAALLEVDGDDEFEASDFWNARSLYFDGPDGSILELIERRHLDNSNDDEFGPASLLGVSEVGIAAPDVIATVAELRDRADVPEYGATGPGFAPVGDAEGLLILVTPGRTWFPTADRTADERAITVHASGGTPGRYPIGTRGALVLHP